MRRILVAIDIDARAPAALALARSLAELEARIRVVHAGPAARPGDAAALAAREAQLETLRKHASCVPGAEHKQLEGPPARAILEEAHAWRADTIVVAPRARSGGRILTGSVSAKVLRHASANVLLARRSGELRSILVCTDLHEPSRRAAALAARLVERARASATLLHAADPALWGPRTEATWPPQPHGMDADWLERARQDATHQWLASQVRTFCSQFLGGRATTRIEVGEPRDVLVREAARHDLVVVGTHGPSPCKRATVGSVAEHVAARASSSVLVVRA